MTDNQGPRWFYALLGLCVGLCALFAMLGGFNAL